MLPVLDFLEAEQPFVWLFFGSGLCLVCFPCNYCLNVDYDFYCPPLRGHVLSVYSSDPP